MARPVSAKLTVEESTLQEFIESLLSLSLRARGRERRGEWERGGEGALLGGLLLGAAILRDKLRHMGSPPRAKSSSASDPPEPESLSCKTCRDHIHRFSGQKLCPARLA